MMAPSSRPSICSVLMRRRISSSCTSAVPNALSKLVVLLRSLIDCAPAPPIAESPAKSAPGFTCSSSAPCFGPLANALGATVPPEPAAHCARRTTDTSFNFLALPQAVYTHLILHESNANGKVQGIVIRLNSSIGICSMRAGVEMIHYKDS